MVMVLIKIVPPVGERGEVVAVGDAGARHRAKADAGADAEHPSQAISSSRAKIAPAWRM
jgi:hypothetical protein